MLSPNDKWLDREVPYQYWPHKPNQHPRKKIMPTDKQGTCWIFSSSQSMLLSQQTLWWYTYMMGLSPFSRNKRLIFLEYSQFPLFSFKACLHKKMYGSSVIGKELKGLCLRNVMQSESQTTTPNHQFWISHNTITYD